MKTSLWQTFREKAARSPRKIILSDGEDSRVVEAAARAQTERIAFPVLVGRRQKIEPLWKKYSATAPEIIDPTAFDKSQKESFTTALAGLAKYKTLTAEELQQRLKDTLITGCLALRLKCGEGLIGGAARTTGDTLRAAFSIVGLQHGIATLFGFFLIEKRRPAEASDPLVLLADCAVIPEPSVKQLAHIGIQGAKALAFFTGLKPKVAFLSFSTHGSAEHPFVDKMREALSLAREKAPELVCEGEWQADAALDRFTAGVKGVGSSPMAGQANVLVVPDLNCGNIAYKLIQRLGDCRAVGPVLWGMNQPANDLSRGCTMEDVLDMLALTVMQAQGATVAEIQNPLLKVQVP